MASIKFLNLKNKKKINMIESIGKVLSESEVENISIADLAEEAEISRGTFYNYFDDKNDAVRTYVEYNIIKFMDFFQENLSLNNNDFIGTVRKCYDSVMQVFGKEIYRKIVKNLKYISEVSRIVDIEKKMEKKMHSFVKYVYDNADKEKLPIKTLEDAMIIVQLAGNVILSSLARLAVGADPYELKQQFERKIEIIERGIKG